VQKGSPQTVQKGKAVVVLEDPLALNVSDEEVLECDLTADNNLQAEFIFSVSTPAVAN
jgi:hypothetical protein